MDSTISRKKESTGFTDSSMKIQFEMNKSMGDLYSICFRAGLVFCSSVETY